MNSLIITVEGVFGPKESEEMATLKTRECGGEKAEPP